MRSKFKFTFQIQHFILSFNFKQLGNFKYSVDYYELKNVHPK